MKLVRLTGMKLKTLFILLIIFVVNFCNAQTYKIGNMYTFEGYFLAEMPCYDFKSKHTKIVSSGDAIFPNVMFYIKDNNNNKIHSYYNFEQFNLTPNDNGLSELLLSRYDQNPTVPFLFDSCSKIKIFNSWFFKHDFINGKIWIEKGVVVYALFKLKVEAIFLGDNGFNRYINTKRRKLKKMKNEKRSGKPSFIVRSLVIQE